LGGGHGGGGGMWDEPLPASPRAGAGATEGGAGGSAIGPSAGERPAVGTASSRNLNGGADEAAGGPLAREGLSNLFGAVAAVLWNADLEGTDVTGAGNCSVAGGAAIVRLIRGFLEAHGADIDYGVGASLVCTELFGVWAAQHAEGHEGLAPFPHAIYGHVIRSLSWERQLLYLLWKSARAQEGGDLEAGLAAAFSALCRACHGILAGVCHALSEEWHGQTIGRLLASELAHALGGDGPAGGKQGQEWAEGEVEGLPLAATAVVLLKFLGGELREWRSKESDDGPDGEKYHAQEFEHLVGLDAMARIASERLLGRCIIEWDTVQAGGSVLALVYAAQAAEPEVAHYTQNVFQGIMGSSDVTVPKGLSMEHCRGMLNLKSVIRQCAEKAGLGAQAVFLGPEALERHLELSNTASLAESRDIVPDTEPPEIVLGLWSAGVYEGQDALKAILQSQGWALVTDEGVALVESVSGQKHSSSAMSLDVMEHVSSLLRSEEERNGPSAIESSASHQALRKIASAALLSLAECASRGCTADFERLAHDEQLQPVRDLLRRDSHLTEEASSDLTSISNRMVDSEHSQGISSKEIYVLSLVLPRLTVRKFLRDATLNPSQAPMLVRALTDLRPYLQHGTPPGGATLFEEELRAILGLSASEWGENAEGFNALVRLALISERKGCPPLVSKSSMLEHVLLPVFQNGRLDHESSLALAPLSSLLEAALEEQYSDKVVASVLQSLLRLQRERSFGVLSASSAVPKFPFAELQKCVRTVLQILCSRVKPLLFDKCASSAGLLECVENMEVGLIEADDWRGMIWCSGLFELCARALGRDVDFHRTKEQVWAAISRNFEVEPDGFMRAFCEACGTLADFAATFEELFLRTKKEIVLHDLDLLSDLAYRIQQELHHFDRPVLHKAIVACLQDYVPKFERAESMALLRSGVPALLQSIHWEEGRHVRGPQVLRVLARQLWAAADPLLFRWVETAVQLSSPEVRFCPAHLEGAHLLHVAVLSAEPEEGLILQRMWGQFCQDLMSNSSGVTRVVLASWLFRRTSNLPLKGGSPAPAGLLELLKCVGDPGVDCVQAQMPLQCSKGIQDASDRSPLVAHISGFALRLIQRQLTTRSEAELTVVRAVLAQKLATEEPPWAPESNPEDPSPQITSHAVSVGEGSPSEEEGSELERLRGATAGGDGKGLRRQYSREALLRLRPTATQAVPLAPDMLEALASISLH